MSAGALPNLIVIGAGRCGTTSLHQQLSEHPEIAMSRTKELRFFADAPELESAPPRDPVDRHLLERQRGNWQRGVGWYRAQFDPAAPVRGEASPVYTAPGFTRCAGRIAELVPDARLVFCVRDPVERAISNYRHAHALGNDPRPPDEALRPDGIYALTSRYADRLAPFWARFPAERILILDREDPGMDAAPGLAEVLRFLGVDEAFRPDGLERRWNASTRQHGLAWRTIVRLRRLPGWPRIASLPPRRALWAVERLTGARSGPALAGPSQAARRRLAASLMDDAARFRELTGRPFARWSV
jgi:hypothetical protein